MELELERLGNGIWELDYKGDLMESGTLKECAMWLVRNSDKIETRSLKQ